MSDTATTTSALAEVLDAIDADFDKVGAEGRLLVLLRQVAVLDRVLGDLVTQGQRVGGLGGRLVGHLGGAGFGVVVDGLVDRLGLLDGIGRRDLELLGLVLLGHVLLHQWWFGWVGGKVGAGTRAATA